MVYNIPDFSYSNHDDNKSVAILFFNLNQVFLYAEYINHLPVIHND